MQLLTLVFLVKTDQVCLAMKKRGFGEGKWNGYGGKVEPDESVESAALRELTEESLVTAQKQDLTLIAKKRYYHPGKDVLEVHTFFLRTWHGEPQETEEMRPAWFLRTEIPFEKMWVDDIHWFPRVLAGEKLFGQVWFDDTGEQIEQMKWETVVKFD